VKTKNIRQSAGILQSRESVKLKIIIKTALLLCVFCGSVFAQKPKIAVYVAEEASVLQDERSALRTTTLNTLVRSNKYEVIERSNVIETELQKQASGEVDDDQVTAFGKQLGAQYICVADMAFLREGRVNRGTTEQPKWHNTRERQVSARIINVETAEVVAIGVIEADIQSGQDISQAVNRAVSKMLGTLRPSRDDLPGMAVYVLGSESQRSVRGRLSNAERALYAFTLEALFLRSKSRGDFIVVERSEAFTKQINREQDVQRDGHVDNNQIALMGKQYGVGDIVIVSIERAMGTNNISARLVNVETASVAGASQLHHQDGKYNDLQKIAMSMVRDIMARSPAELEADRKAKDAKEKADAKSEKWTIIWGAIALIGLGVLIYLNPDNTFY